MTSLAKAAPALAPVSAAVQIATASNFLIIATSFEAGGCPLMFSGHANRTCGVKPVNGLRPSITTFSTAQLGAGPPVPMHRAATRGGGLGHYRVTGKTQQSPDMAWEWEAADGIRTHDLLHGKQTL
jgi:hypothetical protein